MKYTEEQLAIINSTQNRIKVNARAGSGKTKTCRGYIEKRTEGKTLYLVYNKSMKDDASIMFKGLSNVDIKTTYSMAYGSIGYQYKDRLTGNFSLYDLANIIGVRMANKDSYAYISKLLEALNKYFSSHIKDISAFGISEGLNSKAVKDLNRAFKGMSKKNGKSPVPHGLYFKLWHLSNPDLSKYSTVIVDEFQDSTGVIIDILKNNNDVKNMLVVGDEYQNIYGFLHTVNGLDLLDWEEYRLTKSFRIGSQLSDEVQSLISDANFKIEGVNAMQKVKATIDKSKPYFMLCRYNLTIIEESLVAIEEGKNVYIEGGYDGIGLAFINQIYNFRFFNKKSLNLMKYGSYEEMLDVAKSSNDIKILQADNLIKIYGKSLYYKLKLIKDSLIKDYSKADISFSTAHKSKGRTIDIPVLMADDFYEAFTRDETDFRQELNATYVAMTRANSDIQLFTCGVKDELFARINKLERDWINEVGSRGYDFITEECNAQVMNDFAMEKANGY